LTSEIIALADTHCNINQSVISKLRRIVAVPRNDNDRDAVISLQN